MDNKKLNALREERADVVGHWIRQAVAEVGEGAAVELVRMREEHGVYWRIGDLRPGAPALLGISERALEKFEPAEMIDLLRPGEGLLLRSDGALVGWNPKGGVS